MVFNFSTIFVFFKQNTAYEMRISDWSSDVCSSDLEGDLRRLLRIDEDGVLPRLVLRRLAVALEHLEMMTVEVHGVRPAGVVAEINHDSAHARHAEQRLLGLAGDAAEGPRNAGSDKRDRKRTRLHSITNAHLECRHLLEQK